MKTALAAAAFVYLTMFVLTTFVPWNEARQQAAAAGFPEAAIANGLEYAMRWRLLMWAHEGAYYLFYFAVIVSGAARSLALTFHAWTGGRWFLTLLLMLISFKVANALLALPFGVMGFELQHAWDMTNRSYGDWLRDRAVGFLIGPFFWGCAAIYVLMRLLPRTWWLWATGLLLVLGISYAILQPLVIAPLFNTFTPLSQTQWKDLEPKVRALMQRADIEVSEILVIDASRQSQHSNAYFAGFGPTRRIVLYDNLLKKSTPAEIESVLGHEIGHWQHDHIVKGIALAIPAALLGLLALSLILQGLTKRGYLTSPSDPAGVPVVLVLYSLGMWLALPLENAISRHFERQADMAALELARQPDAFRKVAKNLAINNVSNVAPTPWNVWLFASHPTTLEAIQMADAWERTHPK
jgi:STE24 endopeptidase